MLREIVTGVGAHSREEESGGTPVFPTPNAGGERSGRGRTNGWKCQPVGCPQSGSAEERGEVGEKGSWRKPGSLTLPQVSPLTAQC